MREGLPKYISMLLRHHPESKNLHMDHHGWVEVDELISKISTKRNPVTFEMIKNIVDTDNKNRFDIQELNGVYYIRANQGHSIKDIDIGFDVVTPPDVLFHGTAQKSVDSILKSGIEKRGRQYVHLSPDISTAIKVGERHGDVRIFEINAKQMKEDGKIFYLSKNGVWLTDFVDRKYIKLI